MSDTRHGDIVLRGYELLVSPERIPRSETHGQGKLGTDRWTQVHWENDR